MKTDIIIIGGGPAGYKAAGYAAQSGLQVVIIEGKDTGGTCLNCGCIPTKCYAHHADMIRAGAPSDFKSIFDHKNEVVLQLRQAVEALLSKPGITLVKGYAHFTDNHTVAVGDQIFTAPNIIIATGSKPKMPPISGIDSPKVLTSTSLLSLPYVPERLAIVGAGVIGMELASAFSTFGSHVHVYEFLKECLPTIDREIAKRIRKSLEKRGVEFSMKFSVESIDQLDGDKVLIATGRAANKDGLGLESTTIETYKKGILTDDNYQTSVEGVYAVGDVNGKVQLAHAAEFQAKHAVNHIVGATDHIRFDIMPSAVFTYPEAAAVGLTEDDCKNQGIECRVSKALYRANGRALAIGEPEGMVKLVASADGRILGCHAYGAHAADLVQESAAMMNMNAAVSDLASTIHIHPTLSEVLLSAALGF